MHSYFLIQENGQYFLPTIADLTFKVLPNLMNDQSYSTTYLQVVEALALGLGVDRAKIVPEADLREDLHADSMDLVSLAIFLEDELREQHPELEIEPDELTELHTVNDVKLFIERLQRNSE